MRSKIRYAGRNHAVINSTKRSASVRPAERVSGSEWNPRIATPKICCECEAFITYYTSNLAGIQEPLTPTFDRRATDVSPGVVECSSEIPQDCRFLRMQDEVWDASRQRGQECERGEAEFLWGRVGI